MWFNDGNGKCIIIGNDYFKFRSNDPRTILLFIIIIIVSIDGGHARATRIVNMHVADVPSCTETNTNETEICQYFFTNLTVRYYK